jgi:hypothetical protein
MQTLKNTLTGVPAKVRQSFQAAKSAAEVEAMVFDIIHDALEAGATQMESIK